MLPTIEADLQRMFGETLMEVFQSGKTGIEARIYVNKDKQTYTAVAVRGVRACVMDWGATGPGGEEL